MHRNAWSGVKVNGTFNYDFLVQVGLNQGSVLSPLLFIIVLEVYLEKLGQDVRNSCFMFMTSALVSEGLDSLKG